MKVPTHQPNLRLLTRDVFLLLCILPIIDSLLVGLNGPDAIFRKYWRLWGNIHKTGFQNEHNLGDLGYMHQVGGNGFTDDIRDGKITDHQQISTKKSLNTNKANYQLYDPLESYNNHTVMINFLLEISKRYPKRVNVFTIGKSVDGKDLVAARVTNLLNKSYLKPKVKLIGNMHGDESISRQLMLQLIKYLASDNSKKVVWMLNNTDIYILPTMNPDGFEAASEGICNSLQLSGRENMNGVDLNRDFPVMRRPHMQSHEPETEHIIAWSERIPFVLSANFHGGALVVSYPLDFFNPNHSSSCVDDKLVRHLALTYANHQEGGMREGDTCSDKDPGYITNGADWYPFYGSMQDYNYFHTTSIELTVELSCCKYPNRSEIRKYWTDNKQSLLEFTKQANLGIKGYIRDSLTGYPIPNAIVIAGDSKDTKVDAFGAYWKLLLPGTHFVTVKAAGYMSVTRKLVLAPRTDATSRRIDFLMQLYEF